MPNNNEIDFEIFKKLNNIIEYFYKYKDDAIIHLRDNVKYHKLLKNEDIWKQYFSFMKRNTKGMTEDDTNLIVITDISIQLFYWGFK